MARISILGHNGAKRFLAAMEHRSHAASSSPTSVGEGLNVVNRTIIATTLFLGMSLTARADSATYTWQGSRTETPYLRKGACLNERDALTNGSARSRPTKRCSRGQGRRQIAGAIPGHGRSVCTADVLHTEELTGAPIFYHLVRTTLAITSPDKPAFNATTEELIPWQVPPHRKGRRFRLRCDQAIPANPIPFTFH
jgi:hypothetical protein